MKMIEYVGLPGVGKSTKMSIDFPDYSPKLVPTYLPSLIWFSDLIFFLRLYGLVGYKRVYHSIRLTILISLNKDVLVLDQGLFQLYLSHCAASLKKISKDDLNAISKRIERKSLEAEIIVLIPSLSLKAINGRLKRRNDNRANGLDLSFYSCFNENLDEFLLWVSTKDSFRVTRIAAVE